MSARRSDPVQVHAAYLRLRERGKAPIGLIEPVSVAAVRRRAARDGLLLQTSTTRDYMGRATTMLALVDPHTGLLVGR